MTVALRHFVFTAAVCGAFFWGTVLSAAELSDSDGWDVAQDSQRGLESAPEARVHAKDARWLNKPFSVGLSTIVGEAQGLDYMFLTPSAELSYALPYVSFGATLGYRGGVNASLAVRGRLHLGDAVALTLGARGALQSLNRICWGECSEGFQEWDHSLFAGGELGVEGRSEGGFMWRVQAGVSGMLAQGSGSCTNQGASPCYVVDAHASAFITQELTLGYAF